MGKTLDSRDQVYIAKSQEFLKTFSPKPPHQTPHKSLKMMWKILTVALFATCVCADLVEEEGDARLGYITVGNSGATTLTFNATSIQNAIILGLFILVLGALVLPLFGVSLEEEEETGYGYGYEQPAEYADTASAYGYAKRSVDSFGPVLSAMASAQEKYE